MMLGFLAAFAAQAAGPCADDPHAELEAAVAAIDEAYSLVDEAAFDRASKVVDASVSCLEAPPPPSTLARLHRTMALISFVNGQMRAARRALAAARLVDPAWRLDEKSFPEGHPYRDIWTAATDPGPVQEIGDIRPRVFVVDGVERPEAPTERAFLLQISEDGAIDSTLYLFAFTEIPDVGQYEETRAWETPHAWSLGAVALGRLVAARQRSDAVAWDAQQASGLGAAARLDVRYTPLAFVGGEVSASGHTHDDVVDNSALGAEGHALLLAGAAAPVGRGAFYTSARVGGALNAVRDWPNGAEGPRPRSWVVPALSLGGEIGLRDARNDFTLATDVLLASAVDPYRIAAHFDGARQLSGPLSGTLTTRFARSWMQFEDEESSDAGTRTDTELAVGVGLALWY